MSLGGRDEVAFVYTKSMTEKRVVIVTCTTLHNENQSCRAHNNFYHKLLTVNTTWTISVYKARTTRQFAKETNQKKSNN
jgi:hypothetical protein